MLGTLPPRATSLCVPGTRPERHVKALALPCDEVVLDLEDAVAAHLKDAARATVLTTPASGNWGSRRVAVRVNAGSTEDLEAVAGVHGVPGLTVLLPKVERPEEVASAATVLDGTGIGLQALIETPAGSAAAHELAAAHPSPEALVLGYADLAAELGRRGAEVDPPRWLVHQERVLGAPRVIGIGLAHATRALPGLVTVLAWRSCDHLGPVFEEDRLSTRVEVLAVAGPDVDLRVTVTCERGPVLDWQPVVLHAA